MVCNRCIMVVKTELEKLGFTPISVQLGEAEIPGVLEPDKKNELNTNLRELGFEIIDDKRSRLIEKIKNLLIGLVYSEESPKINYSDYLSSALHHEYSYLSKLFSEVQGMTIEQYFITQKIERVKELLVYDELSLSEIADQLGYSSVSHLSKQFKKNTGLTPTYFKRLKEHKRTPIDDL